MRRFLTWLVVSLGVAAVLRRLRRRSRQPEDVAASDVGSQAEADADDGPADELRRKLAESRVEDESAEPSPASEASVDDRRAEVHDQGRSALGEMRGADES